MGTIGVTRITKDTKREAKTLALPDSSRGVLDFMVYNPLEVNGAFVADSFEKIKT
jgi:hypothetical protein